MKAIGPHRIILHNNHLYSGMTLLRTKKMIQKTKATSMINDPNSTIKSKARWMMGIKTSPGQSLAGTEFSPWTVVSGLKPTSRLSPSGMTSHCVYQDGCGTLGKPIRCRGTSLEVV